MTTNERAVVDALSKYEDALNASDTDAVMPLYIDDGVFMPPSSPSAVGRDALRKAYDAVFEAITLNVEFKIAEVVEVGPGWVFARTNSAGTNTDNGNRPQECGSEPGTLHLQERQRRKMEDRPVCLLYNKPVTAVIISRTIVS